MHQQNTTAPIQVVRGPPKCTNERTPHPHLSLERLQSNLTRQPEMQKIKLDHRRRNNNLNVQCGSDDRKQPSGRHPSPDGASEQRYAKSFGCTVCPAGELLTQNNVLLFSLAHVNLFPQGFSTIELRGRISSQPRILPLK